MQAQREIGTVEGWFLEVTIPMAKIKVPKNSARKRVSFPFIFFATGVFSIEIIF